MRVSEKEARALARWAVARRTRVRELLEGDRFVDERGHAWLYLGDLRALPLVAGVPVRGAATNFRARHEVVRLRVRGAVSG